jgi:ligand-binding SRPBCC domain-containing protein
MIEFGRDGRNFFLHTEQLLRAPLDTLYPFFADAQNLEELTPPFLRFRIRTPMPIEMRVGALIDYRIHLHGIPVPWRTRIASWEPPFRFVDEQVWGPYLRWHHEHRFVDEGAATRVIDHVEYRVPLGAPVERFLVRNDLRTIFEYRRAQMAKRFGELGTRAEA